MSVYEQNSCVYLSFCEELTLYTLAMFTTALYFRCHVQSYLYVTLPRIAGSKAWQGKPWTEPAHVQQGQCSPRLGANLFFLSRVSPSYPSHEGGECVANYARQLALRRSAEAHPSIVAPKDLVSQNLKEFTACLTWQPAMVAIW